jgi:hypothetical protein
MSLTRKLQSVKGLTTSQIKLIARHMPRDTDTLASALANEGQLSDKARARVLEITSTHVRDQKSFDECLSHVQAFAKGGPYGMQMLNTLIDVILGHFAMEKERWEILTSANVSMDLQTGKLIPIKGRGN